MGQAKEIVDRMWDAMDTHNADAMAQLFASNGEVTLPGGVRVHGPDELCAMLQGYFEAFPDLRHDVLDYVESGEKIAVELRVTGTQTATMQTPTVAISATGKQVVWESVDFITTAGGKVQSWHTYFDQVAFLTQLGLMPEPEQAPA